MVHAKDNPYKQDIIEPVIYSIKSNKVKEYVNILNNMESTLRNHISDVERMLIELTYSKDFNVKFVNELCVGGYSAVTGIYRDL